MWLFTDTGFVSAVVSKEDRKMISVRARDKKSLESFVKMFKVKIVELQARDYEYRVYITKKQLTEWLNTRVDELNYDNFKTQVSKTRGFEFAEPLHGVWYEMLEVSDKRKKTKKGSSLASRWYEEDYSFPHA
jgi:hypothetical protein